MQVHDGDKPEGGGGNTVWELRFQTGEFWDFFGFVRWAAVGRGERSWGVDLLVSRVLFD